MTLFPTALGGTPVVYFETIGSTNEVALARARAGEPGPLWIVAGRQTAGHGRRGRKWVSEPGNLYATLLLLDPAPAAVAAQLCFVAALALHDAVLDTCAGLAPARLKLKWPNDLLLDGEKVAGILIEATSLPSRRIAAAVGFGVNCEQSPAVTEFPATDFARAGFGVLATALFSALGPSMQARLSEWKLGEQFSSIRAAWLARATGVGGAIEVRLFDRTIDGVFQGLDAEGALLIKRTNGSRETITAGDVFPIGAE
jgi:BirA family biotin operon repressor/biotin-[acetyl-CoA-carboxylase] ligase